MIIEADILMGRDTEYPLTPEMEKNVNILVKKLAELSMLYSGIMTVSSGYRPGRFNIAAHGAKHSSHMTCEAVDIHDIDSSMKKWCVENIDKLAKLGLYMEDPAHTPTWVHLQTRKTSGNPFKVG